MAATRGLDRGRADQASVERAYAEDLERWIEIQRQAGLDFFSDGQLEWQDLFRPLVAGTGTQPHTLVRWFDTNTFYREPEFPRGVTKVSPATPALPRDSLPTPRALTLPSPYLFSRVAKTSEDRDRLMGALATNLLRPLIEAAVAGGTRLVHLQEPWLPYEGIEERSWAALRDALDVLHHGLKVTLVLHAYFGDAAPYVARLRDLPIDALGVDLIETDVTALGRGWDKGLVAGIVDGRASRLEQVDSLVTAARFLADQVKPRDLYLTSTTELAYLPVGVAEQKVLRLGEAARQLKKELVTV